MNQQVIPIHADWAKTLEAKAECMARYTGCTTFYKGEVKRKFIEKDG
jgi:hypothetical protein